MKVINSFIGKDANDEFVLIFETKDCYYMQYWYPITYEFKIEKLPAIAAEAFINNNIHG